MVEEPSGHWQEHLPDRPATVSFLPLAGAEHQQAGWCTYAAVLEEAPDVEVMCGGKNSKLPSAAAVWRQGNLLHFGFQQDPSQLNQAGRDLLENCIVYIAAFRQDRPLGDVRSPFRPGPRRESVVWLDSTLKSADVNADAVIRRFFAEARQRELSALGADAALAWIRQHRQFLVPQPDGRLDLCPDLQALQLDVRDEAFLGQIRGRLDGDAPIPAAACRVLHRHLPEGPRGNDAPAGTTAWAAFLDQNREQLFFSEHAGCVWLVDTLARSRGMPSQVLRGPARKG